MSTMLDKTIENDDRAKDYLIHYLTFTKTRRWLRHLVGSCWSKKRTKNGHLKPKKLLFV